MAGDVRVTPGSGVRAITDDEVAFYRANGWVHLPGLFPSELTEDLLQRVQARMGSDSPETVNDDRATIMSPQLAALWRNWQDPSEEDDFFRALAHSREFARIASRLNRDVPVRHWSDSILCKLPARDGGSKTPWHQDFPYHAMDTQGILNIWVALVDVPPEMGSLRFLNGSHQLGPMGRVVHRTDGVDALDLHPWIAEEHEVSPPLHLEAGDATVHNLLTVHAAAQNDTDRPRWAYVTSLFPADALYTGSQQRKTDGLNLTVNQPFDHPRFPLLET